MRLTFDDGPHPVHTPEVLDVLARHRVTATFFCIGAKVVEHPEIVRRIVAEGHEVANHSWSHVDFTTIDRARFVEEVATTSAAIEAACGRVATELRAPYGSVNDNVREWAAEAGLELVGWDIDPNDWARPGTDVIVERVLSALRPGVIVLLHDGGGDRSQTVAALDRISAGIVAAR